MAATRLDPLQAILNAYGFEGWSSRRAGQRLRCPHGLLIGTREECPVGCISPLLILGFAEPIDVDKIAAG